MSDLITTSNIVPADVFVEGGLDPTLATIKERIEDFEMDYPDIQTVKGRKEIKSFAYKVAQSKTLLDDMGKDLTAEIKATAKGVDAERKRVRDILDTWRDEIRQPVTDYEKEEAAREAFLQDCLDELGTLGAMPTGATVDKINAQITRVNCVVIDDTWGDREGLAGSTKEKVLEKLQERRADRLQFEEQQAELEMQKQENERLQAKADARARQDQEAEDERARQENAVQDAQDAEEQATADAEQRTKDDEEAAEKVLQDERDRVKAAQDAEDAAALKREANKRHRGKFNTAAKKAFMEAGLSEDDAKLAVTAIAAGNVPNVKISY